MLFDQVRVPRVRIFLYGDFRAVNELKSESEFYTQVSHQTLCRYIAKTEFFLGAAENLASLVDINDNVNELISEILVALEILQALLLQAEAKAKKNKWGVLVPDKNTMLVVNRYFPKIYPQMMNIVQMLASSRIVMIPSEADTFSSFNSYSKVS